MPAIRIQEGASHRLDDIYRYTRDRWGDDQAEKYITGLFAAFDKIAAHGVVSKPIPAAFRVEGFFFGSEQQGCSLRQAALWTECASGWSFRSSRRNAVSADGDLLADLIDVIDPLGI